MNLEAEGARRAPPRVWWHPEHGLITQPGSDEYNAYATPSEILPGLPRGAKLLRSPRSRRRVAYPVGRCYCGCGTELGPASLFARGHDKIAEASVITAHYGNVAGFLVAHGYGPDTPTPDAP